MKLAEYAMPNETQVPAKIQERALPYEEGPLRHLTERARVELIRTGTNERLTPAIWECNELRPELNRSQLPNLLLDVHDVALAAIDAGARDRVDGLGHQRFHAGELRRERIILTCHDE